MSRVYNFSAGPAVLPLEVLQNAQADLVDYKGCGMSVMEMSSPRSRSYAAWVTTGRCASSRAARRCSSR